MQKNLRKTAGPSLPRWPPPTRALLHLGAEGFPRKRDVETNGVADNAHRRFLNSIVEERTVIDGEGNTHQVADGYDRYFRRRSDGAWIGTRGHRGLSDMPGVNPDDYEEGKSKL